MRDELDIEIDEHRKATASHSALCDCEDCLPPGPGSSSVPFVPSTAICEGMSGGGPRFPAFKGCGRTFKPTHRHQAICPACLTEYNKRAES